MNGLGHPVERLVTPGQASDIGLAEALLGDHEPEAVTAGKGYDKQSLVDTIEARRLLAFENGCTAKLMPIPPEFGPPREAK